MKLFQALVVVGSAALPALVSAASPYDSLYVHVPFEFVAAGQSFSPGDYHVQRGENGVILIQGNGKAAATISVPGSMAKPGAATGLKFSSDGQREHLVTLAGRRRSDPNDSFPSRNQQKSRSVVPLVIN